MNSLSKVVVLFAILGVLGAGLFFFPQSPMHYTKITTIIVKQEPAAETAEKGAAADDAPIASEEQADEELDNLNQ